MAPRIIGIDPSLTATGIVALTPLHPAAVDLTNHLTIRTTAKELIHQRLYSIRTVVRETLIDFTGGSTGGWQFIVENPTDFQRVRTPQGRNPETIALLGLAAGVIIEATFEVAREFLHEFYMYGVSEWYPKTKNRRGRWHPMKKQHTLGMLRRAYPALEKLNEHETMASGVALYHVRRLELESVGGTGAEAWGAER